MAIARNTAYDRKRNNLEEHFGTARSRAMRDLDDRQLQSLDRQYRRAREALEREFANPAFDDFNDALRYGLENKFNVQPMPKAAVPTFDPNKVASLTMELTELEVAWAARFARCWIKESDFENPESTSEEQRFWHHAFKRLRMHSKFESYNAWSRLKECV